MSEDPSRTDRPAFGAAGTAASAARSVRQERVAAVLEGWEAVGRWAVFTGGIVQAGLLLVARIWLSQAVFVHQIMAMMRATGFSEAPSVGSTLIQSVAPLLLASGLATRPVALLLLFGVGRDVSEAHLAGPHAVLLVWLLIGLYNDPTEWPWTYVGIICAHGMFAVAQAGRSLGIDNLLAKRLIPGLPYDGALARAISVAT